MIGRFSAQDNNPNPYAEERKVSRGNLNLNLNLHLHHHHQLYTQQFNAQIRQRSLPPAAMDTDQVMNMVNLLDDQVDDIEEALAPLLKSALQDIAAKLPVVDKARLYVLTTYAIDSLVFCTCPPPVCHSGASSLTVSSIPETQWRQCPRTPRYARARARQTVRQED